MLCVKDWDELYENNRTRELRKLDWVPVPNQMDGDGYTALLDHKEGAAHLGAWLAILQIASKCQIRGRLAQKTGDPHDAKSLARRSRIPERVFAAAIPRLLEIKWLEESAESRTNPAPIPHQSRTNPAPSPREVAEIPRESGAIPHHAADISRHARVEGKGREEKGTESSSSETVDELAAGLARLGIPIDDDGAKILLRECRKNYPAVEIPVIIEVSAWKLPQIRRARNPVGFLLTAVPNACFSLKRMRDTHPFEGRHLPPPGPPAPEDLAFWRELLDDENESLEARRKAAEVLEEFEALQPTAEGVQA